ncbi:MAG: hypothetical protein ACTHJ0_10120 [Flavipsychrobacter sp.]
MNGLTHPRKSAELKFYTVVIAGALLLMLPAFYNGYPLLTGDSAVYLQFGFKALTPFEKSIAYGMIVWVASMNGLSLWPVIFLQAYVTSYLVIRLYHQLTGTGFSLKHLWPLLILLFTGLPWVVCQLQPDIFIAIALMAATILVIAKTSKADAFILYCIFVIAIATHVAQVPLFIFTLAILFLFRKRFSGPSTAISITTRISMLILLSAAGTIVMGPVLLRSKQVYIFSSLLQHGTLKQYLDDNCAHYNYKLCKYRDSLPQNAHYFLWDNNSPLNKEGGLGGLNTEINDIIHSSLTSSRYLLPYLRSAFTASEKQLFCFTVAELPDRYANEDVQAYLSQYLPHELVSFNNSRQSKGLLQNGLQVCNSIAIIVILLSLIVMAYALLKRNLSAEGKMLLYFCIILILFNAFECGFFSVASGRYSSRILWLLALCAIIYVQPRKKQID